ELLDGLDAEVHDIVGNVAGIALLDDLVAAQPGISQVAFRLIVRASRAALENEVVEAALAGIGGQVPFANDAGLITIALEDLGQSFLGRIEVACVRGEARVLQHSIQVVVLAGEQGGAAGRAESVGTKAVGEAQALIRDAVDVRSLHQAAAIAAQHAERHAFAGNPEDVGAFT